MQRLRILLVEDYPDCTDTTRQLLDVWGHEVVSVGNGPEAVRRAQEHRPDVVLLDIGLPGIDGWTVARQIREQAHGERPLLVAVTGYGHEEDRRKSAESGIDTHLLKPVDPAYLNRLLDKWQRHLEYRRRI
jgi:CheY-like chemotaxis protein